MDFKNVKTYGRFRNRVIKTDLWISPQVKRNRLFVSTSSESSNSSVNKSEQNLAGSVANESQSSESISSPVHNLSSTKKNFTQLSNDSNREGSTHLSSLEKDNASLVLVEHSTPFSTQSSVTVRPRRLIPVCPVISPLCISESPLDAAAEELKQFDSPNLFSDESQEDEDSCNTTNENEARLANGNDDSCSVANESHASCRTANNGEASCHTANENQANSNAVVEGNTCDRDWTNDLNEDDLSLQHGISKSSARSTLGDDIQNTSNKLKTILSLNESPIVNISSETACPKAEHLTTSVDHVCIEDSLSSIDLSGTDVISSKLKELRLLDAKIYLDRNDVLRSTGTVTNHANIITTKENMSDSSDVDPPTHSENDIPSLPSSDKPPQHIPRNLGKECTAEVTPTNIDVHTPMTGGHTGKIVRDPNYSSFVEALTPATFQQSQKRPLAPKQKILVQCEQQKPVKFTEALTPSVLAQCVKVGEGTYGEVYKTNDGLENVALKVIPIAGNFTVNDEPQKSFEEMIPEIVISKELSSLGDCDSLQDAVHVCSNFIKVKRVMLVQDSYPEKLLQEWDRWRNNHDCENERPDMFESDQYFVVFEFLDGGEDLERFQFSSMDEALSVIQQVALSLSVAEQSLMFEHRDLHWGNVLIKRSRRKTIHYTLCGQDICVKSAGVFVSIIDFTLSRLTKDGVTVFCDLSKDPDIFKGKGDYQFQVYRLMRKANNNDWEGHEPYSNVLWLRYLLDKVLNAKKYKKPNNSVQRNLRTYLRQVLSYESALQAVQDGFLGIDVTSTRQ